MPRNDEIDILDGCLYLVLGILKLHLLHQEVLGIWKTLRRRTDEHEIANLRWIAKCKAQATLPPCELATRAARLTLRSCSNAATSSAS